MTAESWPMTTHTETQQGYVPHLLMTLNGQSFLSPVKVIPLTSRLAQTEKPWAVEEGGATSTRSPAGKRCVPNVYDICVRDSPWGRHVRRRG